MKELFKNKVFNLIMVTDFLQQISIWVRNIALLFYIMEITHGDPIAVSILSVLEYLPIFLFSFLGGTLADRLNPKKVMIAGDTLSALSIGLIIVFIALGLWQAAFAATFVSAVISQFSVPSSVIMLKKHLADEMIDPAIALSQSSTSLFVIVGPILGTLIYSSFGILGSLTVITLLFLVSALLLLLLPASVRPSNKVKESILKEMKEGFGYVLQSRNLVVIAAAFILIGLGSGLIQPLDIYVITERLGLQKESLQWFYSLAGIGLLGGGIAAATLAQRMDTRKVLFVSLCFFSLSVAIEALSVWVVLTAGMRFLTGVMGAFLQIVLSSLLIKTVEEKYLGRTNGIITPLYMAGIVAGSAVSGLLMKTVTLIPTFFLSSVLLLAAAFVCLSMKSNGKVQELEEQRMPAPAEPVS